MDLSRTAESTTDSMEFDVVDEGSSEQRLDRPRSARHNSQRRSVNVGPVESCVSPSFSTTSTIDDSEDAEEEFPPVLGDQVAPPRALHYLQPRPTSPPDSRMLTSITVDQRSRSSSRSPTSTMAASGGLCMENLTEARQRVLERYDRKQRPPSSVSRRENVDNDARMSTLPAGVDDCSALRRHRQRLEPLTTVNVQASSACGVQHHH